MRKRLRRSWLRAVVATVLLALFAVSTEAAIAWTPIADAGIQDIDYSSNVVTWSSVSIGTASADRIVVAYVGTDWDGRTFTSLTVGGDAMTKAVDSGNSAGAIYYLAVASGTTADFVVTFNSAVRAAGLMVGILTGAEATPSATGTYQGSKADPQTLTSAVTIPTDGVGIIGFSVAQAPPLRNYTDVTEDFWNITATNTITLILGSHTSAGSWDPEISSATGGNYDYDWTTLVAVTWAPGAAAGGPPQLPLMGVGN